MSEENKAVATEIVQNASETAIRSQSDLTAEESNDQIHEEQSQFSEDVSDEEVESALEPEKQETNDNFAQKFGALSRRERELRQREASFKEREAKLEAQIESMREQIMGEFKEQLRTNPLQLLNDNEITFDRLTEMQLNDGKPTTEMQLAAIENKLRKEYNDKIRELEDAYNNDKQVQAEEHYNQVIDDFVGELENFVNTSQDDDGTPKYELIQANNAVDLVFDVIDEHYSQHEKILSKEAAADMVEAYLEEEAKKLLSTKKLGFKKQTDEQQSGDKQQSTTLSNEHTAEAGTPGDRRSLTREQSLAQAAQLLKWDS